MANGQWVSDPGKAHGRVRSNPQSDPLRVSICIQNDMVCGCVWHLHRTHMDGIYLGEQFMLKIWFPHSWMLTVWLAMLRPVAS